MTACGCERLKVSDALIGGLAQAAILAVHRMFMMILFELYILYKLQKFLFITVTEVLRAALILLAAENPRDRFRLVHQNVLQIVVD